VTAVVVLSVVSTETAPAFHSVDFPNAGLAVQIARACSAKSRSVLVEPVDTGTESAGRVRSPDAVGAQLAGIACCTACACRAT